MNYEALREASSALRKNMGKVGKPGSRIHNQAAEENVHRLRALEGICGSCNSLVVEIDRQDNRSVVRLRCASGLDPLELYRGTPFGAEARCARFSKIPSAKNPTVAQTHF